MYLARVGREGVGGNDDIGNDSERDFLDEESDGDSDGVVVAGEGGGGCNDEDDNGVVVIVVVFLVIFRSVLASL